jgi:pimeloyl-ACP methyl ester carboxylesterase
MGQVLPAAVRKRTGGDIAARRPAVVNRGVVARFRRSECGPNKVTAADIDAVACTVLILSSEDDPVTPAGSARRLAVSVRRPVEMHAFAGIGHWVFRQAPSQAFARIPHRTLA